MSNADRGSPWRRWTTGAAKEPPGPAGLGSSHTSATWQEDAGVPARVIEEVMGHEATSRAGQQRGSAMAAHYRHAIPEMAAPYVED